jgi:hypothetical protein
MKILTPTDMTLYGILALFVVLIAFSIYRLQHNPDNQFDLLDILMENGRVSRTAVAFSTTLLITSWIMVKLAIDQKMTEGFLIAYGGMWVAPILARMFATSPVDQKGN